MKKPLCIVAVFSAVLILIPAAALVVLLNFNWNLAKPWLNARPSEALGRPFAIAGVQSLTWEKQTSVGHDQGWLDDIAWPHLVAQGIHIGNPTALNSGTTAEMANMMTYDGKRTHGG